MTGIRRILLATDAVGGVWTYSVELSGALRELGVETLLAVMGPSPTREKLAEVRHARVIDTGLPLDWLADGPDAVHDSARTLSRIATAEDVDLVQLHSAALAADVRFDVPVVAVQHSCVASWWECVCGGRLPADFAWRRDLVEEGLNSADAVVAPTAAFAAQTARLYRLDRPVHAVRNGRTPIPLSKRSRRDQVFTVGRLWDAGKNVRTLDEAAGKLEVPLEAIGPLNGPNGTAVSFEHLLTPGPLPPSAVAERLSGRGIYVSSALYEPFGLAALEAAQAGCALVLSNIPTFRELWNGAALFVDPRDSDGFAAAISGLLENPEKRERLGRAAQLKALQYTPAAMAERMFGIYGQLLARSEPSDAPMPMALFE